MEKIWQLKKKVSDDPIEQLLFNRGIVKKIGSTEDLKKFLEPDFDKDFFDPWLLPDFEVAINRIKSAIGGQEKIGIYADYDADGIPGAALLYRALQTLENQAEIYIPARVDGYGFNKSGIDYLISKGCKLIISVDLGIRELEFAKYIAERNVDLIISDHHEPDDELPKTLAVINPKRKDSKYPFRELCGAGVVFKIIQGLGKFYPKKIDEKFLKWNLDLPAISTISDVVPLISENRIIAKFGLKVLSKTKNIGLQELYKVANIDQNKIDSYTVGFQIGPRINAPGRLDHATESFVLLTTKDPERAYKSAKHLQEKNEVRQIEMEKIFQSAIKIIDSQKLAVGKIIIVKKSGWQKGIIGPVASRIVEKYLRPVIILSEKNGILDGSCRSISGFDITKALQSSEKYLLGFGGHSGAAGVHLEEKDFEKFKEKISEYANEKISEDQLLPKIPIDLELGKRKISVNLFKEFEKFEPFGLGNPKPIFLTSNIKLISHRLVGKENKHLQLRFSDGISETKAVVFNHGIDLKKLISGENYNIVYQPGLNFWNGKNWIDLRLLDIKNSEGASPQI